MILVDIVNRNRIPQAWGEGEYLPWEDPRFSEMMMKERYGFDTEPSSALTEAVEKDVGWIHDNLLGGGKTKILHLGCGPGLYTASLARRGHECVGIDCSHAMIAYAKKTAGRDGLSCNYREHIIHSAVYGYGYGLIMVLDGEFNTLNPMDAIEVIGKLWMALDEGGILLIEPSTYLSFERLGNQAPRWCAENEGIFSTAPHLCLHENRWNARNGTLMKRWYVVDAATGEVRLFARCFQAYTKPLIEKLIGKRDFADIRFHDSPASSDSGDLFRVTAVKKNTVSSTI